MNKVNPNCIVTIGVLYYKTLSMKREYLKAGAKYTTTQEQRDALDARIRQIKWFDLPANDLPFSQGEALREMLAKLGNKPDRVGYITHGAGLPLLAFRNNYGSGEVRRATLYAVDCEESVVSVAVDTETEQDIPTPLQ